MIVKPRTFFCSVALGLVLSATPGYVFYKQLKPQRSYKHNYTRCKLKTQTPVKELQFGMMVPNDQGKMVFVPTNTIARKVGYGYGWRVKYHTKKRYVRTKEVLTLPSAPKTWGISAQTALSGDRRVATTKATARTQRGQWVYNTWWFTEGDPKGQYNISVSVDGKHIKSQTLTIY